MGNNPSFYDPSINENVQNYPVNNVSWLDAVSFCKALTILSMTQGDCRRIMSSACPQRWSGNIPAGQAVLPSIILVTMPMNYRNMDGSGEIAKNDSIPLV